MYLKVYICSPSVDECKISECNREISGDIKREGENCSVSWRHSYHAVKSSTDVNVK